MKMRNCLLGDIITFQRGYDLPKTQMRVGKIPVVGSNGIIGYHDTATTSAPCITIGRSGNVGTPKILYEKAWAHNTTLYIKEFKNVDPIFVFYLLKTLNLNEYAGGSAVPTLNRNHIHSLPICIPTDIKAQKQIAQCLYLIDSKIDHNTQINQNLEAQAQAIFKSWFVDFEPFQDGKFVDSELGLIPDRWQIGTLKEILDIRYGKDHKKLEDGIIPVYGSGGLMRYVNTALYSGESVLIPRKGTLNNVMRVTGDFWTVDTMFYSIPKRNGDAKFAFHILKNMDLASMNSGSAVPSMTTDILNSIVIAIPPQQVLDSFDKITGSLWQLYEANNMINNSLITLRDSLLPKLMSGEIDVSEVEL